MPLVANAGPAKYAGIDGGWNKSCKCSCCCIVTWRGAQGSMGVTSGVSGTGKTRQRVTMQFMDGKQQKCVPPSGTNSHNGIS